eukprot:15562930-Heterocapsa_arctica.AAC.1
MGRLSAHLVDHKIVDFRINPIVDFRPNVERQAPAAVAEAVAAGQARGQPEGGASGEIAVPRPPAALEESGPEPRPRPPRELEVVMPGAAGFQGDGPHASHHMGRLQMIIFCVRCGSYSTTRKSAALSEPCPGVAI